MEKIRGQLMLAFMLMANACVEPEPNVYRIRSSGDTLSIALTKGETNYLRLYSRDSLVSEWPLRYPVYKFLTGDINNDGNDDACVGVIKTTRRDSVMRKRLFIFQVRNKRIIPLWLGSSLGQPLEDFAIKKRDGVTVLRSVEAEKSAKFLVAEYEWFGFGLSFREYLKREIPLEEAKALLQE